MALIPFCDRRVVLDLGKLWGDPDHDYLLDEFRRLHPREFERWRIVEQRLFESRAGSGGYPDQPLMQICRGFIEERAIGEYGTLGSSRAWMVLRGRILRGLIEERPNLHPCPGKRLITQPRTLSDEELSALARAFGMAHPKLWSDWQHIERAGSLEDDPLAPASWAFRQYLMEQCWVQGSMAVSSTFLDVRGLIRGEGWID
jgi:hypothetical protein